MTTALDKHVADMVSDDISQAAEAEISRLNTVMTPLIEQVEHLSVEIPSNPVGLGLQNFHGLLSLVRQNSNTISEALTRALVERSLARTRRDKAKQALETAINLKLSHDPDVQNVAGQQSKIALAKDKLAREQRVLAYCEQLYSIASAYYDVIKAKGDNMKETKSDLMSQLAVIKQQILLGEVNPGQFPMDRGGVGIPSSPLQRAEQELAEELPIKEGVVTF